MRRAVWQTLLILSFIVLLVGLFGTDYLPDSGYIALLGLVLLVVFAFQRYEKPTRPPIFSISVNSAIGLSLFSGFFFTFLLYVGIVGYPFNFLANVIYVLLAGAGFYGSFRLWWSPVRLIEFYDDSFEVKGRDTDSIIRYPDVVEIEKVKRLSFWFIGTRLLIRLRNGDQFFVPGNPTPRGLKKDTYSWLLSKTTLNARG